MQRFMHEDSIIDIIPFGGVSNEDSEISWPSESSIILSVLGFEDALKNAISIIINRDPVLEIKIPTLPGLAVLKILSWVHSYPERQKDTEDLNYI